MSLKTKKILGVNITIENKENILEKTRKSLKKSIIQITNFKKKQLKPVVIFTPNPEIINCAQKDHKFKEIVNTGQINLPDGAGVVWAIKKLHKIKIERISGVDFMLDLCRQSEDLGIVIGVIGGKANLAVETRECLQILYPKLKIEALPTPEVRITNHELRITNQESRITNEDVGSCLPDRPAGGPAGEAGKLDVEKRKNILNTNGGQEEQTKKYFEELCKEIKKRKIGVLFVALGFPKQEYFIDSVKRQALSAKLIRPLVMMAVGGSFDYITGRIPRAPGWMRELGMEWLFRLVKEPWRLKRHLIGSKFFLKILFER